MCTQSPLRREGLTYRVEVNRARCAKVGKLAEKCNDYNGTRDVNSNDELCNKWWILN